MSVFLIGNDDERAPDVVVAEKQLAHRATITRLSSANQARTSA